MLNKWVENSVQNKAYYNLFMAFKIRNLQDFENIPSLLTIKTLGKFPYEWKIYFKSTLRKFYLKRVSSVPNVGMRTAVRLFEADIFSSKDLQEYKRKVKNKPLLRVVLDNGGKPSLPKGKARVKGVK